jgi:hypothetical protein
MGLGGIAMGSAGFLLKNTRTKGGKPMSNLTMDNLLKVMKDFEELQPQFNSPEIDEMIAHGHKIEELVMIHSFPELRDERKIKTKHGYIDMLYTSPMNLEYGTGYIMKKPENPLDVFNKSAVGTM